MLTRFIFAWLDETKAVFDDRKNSLQLRRVPIFMRLLANSEQKLILLGLGGLTLSALLFHLENTRVDSSAFGPPIAKTTLAKKDVRRKGQGSFVFQNIVDGSQLYEGDSVFTGPDSQATITFDGRQTVLTLQPLSQVKVYHGEGRTLQFDLAYGNIEGTITKDESFIVTGAEGRIQSADNSTKINVQRRRDGRVNYTVREGRAVIFDRNGEQNISTRQSLQVDPSTDIRRTPPVTEIDLISPPDATLLLSGKVRHRFLARSLNGAKMIFRFEGPRKTSSSPGLSDADLSSLQWLLPKSSGAEEWSWSVEAFSKNGKLIGRSASRRFSLMNVNRPAFLSPASKSRIFLATDGSPLSVPLRWTLQQDLEPWLKQIRLKKIGPQVNEERSMPKNSNEGTLEFSHPGIYELTLISELSDGQVLEGNPLSLEIKAPLMPPTNLMVPAKVVTTPEILRSGFKIGWRKPKDALNVEIQWSNDLQFSQIETKTAATESLMWIPKNEGRQFFRFRSLRPETISVWSAPVSVEVSDIPASFKDRQKEILVPQTRDGFKPALWSAKIEGQNLLSHFFAKLTNDAGIEIDQKEIKDREIQFSIPQPGTYFVRLSSRGPENVERLLLAKKIRAKEPCGSPILTQPLPHHRFVILGGNISNVPFSWATTACFTNYQVQVESIPPSREKLLDLRKNSVDLKIRVGEYRWRVRGFKENRSPGWSDWSPFSVVTER